MGAVLLFFLLKVLFREKCVDPNKMIDTETMEIGILESDVREALSQDRDSPFLHYLLGLILIDR